jgi:CRP/FNR family transcriptional regulator
MRLIEAVALQELPQRIAFYLLDALQRESGPGLNRLELAVTQRELAKILGATPEALSRALRKISDSGILNVAGRSIRVLNRPALALLAEGDEPALGKNPFRKGDSDLPPLTHFLIDSIIIVVIPHPY